jgi:hydroxymethylbilane synthase
MTTQTIRVGTRGSALAFAQTSQLVGLLKARNPDTVFEIIVAKTLGDKDQSRPLSAFRGQGVFVKELEELLLAEKVDLAVHSLKDVPAVVAEGCVLAAFPIREDPRDVCITRSGEGFSGLARGALVGTGSPRRIVQLKAARNDLRFAEIRGNLDTRIKKLKAGDFDAIVVAAAGLTRLGVAFDKNAMLSEEICLPAIGQGCLAIECRDGDRATFAVSQSVNHEPSRNEVLAERLVMKTIGAGCSVPLACLARTTPGGLHIAARAGDPVTGACVSCAVDLSPAQIDEGAIALADRLLAACKEKNIELGTADTPKEPRE